MHVIEDSYFDFELIKHLKIFVLFKLSVYIDTNYRYMLLILSGRDGGGMRKKLSFVLTMLVSAYSVITNNIQTFRVLLTY